MTATATPSATADAVAQSMLLDIVESVCDRPGETAERREARARDVTGSVLAFNPRDPVEIMLAGMVVTHIELIRASAREALLDQKDISRGRAKSSIVALARVVLGLLKELRLAQKRTLAASLMPGLASSVAAVFAAGVEPALAVSVMPGFAAGADPERSIAVPAGFIADTRAEQVEPDQPLPAANGLPRPRPAARPLPRTGSLPAATPAVVSSSGPAPRPHRRTEASVAAMMAVRSPPVTPCGGGNPGWGASALAGLTQLSEWLTVHENAPGVAARIAREALLSVGKPPRMHRGAAAYFPLAAATGIPTASASLPA